MIAAMAEPTVPLGFFKTLGLWCWDLIQVPTRVAKLAKAAKEERDPRPICAKCGDGRVALTGRRQGQYGSYSYGACQGCGAHWDMADDGTNLHNLVTGAIHQIGS